MKSLKINWCPILNIFITFIYLLDITNIFIINYQNIAYNFWYFNISHFLFFMIIAITKSYKYKSCNLINLIFVHTYFTTLFYLFIIVGIYEDLGSGLHISYLSMVENLSDINVYVFLNSIFLLLMYLVLMYKYISYEKSKYQRVRYLLSFTGILSVIGAITILAYYTIYHFIYIYHLKI